MAVLFQVEAQFIGRENGGMMNDRYRSIAFWSGRHTTESNLVKLIPFATRLKTYLKQF